MSEHESNDEDKKTEYETVGDLVRIFQRGRTWHANFQHDRRQCRTSLKTKSKKEARRRALLLEAELLEGRYEHCTAAPSIESVITLCLKHARTEGRAQKTLQKYEDVYRRALQLASELRRKDILGIDLQFVDEFRHRRVETGKALKTIYNEAMIIRGLVNFAMSRGMITKDPLAGLKIKEPRPRPQPCWSPAEVEQILESCTDRQRPVLTILADTGKRIGELIWLTWDDVDFERNVLHIRPKDNWRPKSGDQRAVPMTPRVFELLKKLPRNHRWVLTAPPSTKYPQGGHQISERRQLAALKRVLRKLGISGHLHTFRHSFISRALMAGVPEAVVRSWVGHVDRDILKLYTHIAAADSQSAMQRLAEAQNPRYCKEKEQLNVSEKKNSKSAHSQHKTPEAEKDDGAK